MCGIAGVLGPVDSFAEDATVVMNAAQRHRGPDQDGVWKSPGQSGVVLGHRRLSILDLSEAGRQPMLDQDSGVALVFNGECYNYRDLRTELEGAGCRFHTGTDTEVVLAAYLQWGRGAIERLRGMFALAIWDGREHSLLLARDRLGIKPLYYSHQNGRLLFASELRALLASDALPRKLDPAGLATFLWHGFVPGPGTLVEGITLLPAGHLVSVKPGDVPCPAAYWRYPATVAGDANAGRKAADALREAVGQHLVSDVPLGIFLSGGVDSSLMAAMAQQAAEASISRIKHLFAGWRRLLADADTCVQRSLPRTDRR